MGILVPSQMTQTALNTVYGTVLSHQGKIQDQLRTTAVSYTEDPSISLIFGVQHSCHSTLVDGILTLNKTERPYIHEYYHPNILPI